MFPCFFSGRRSNHINVYADLIRDVTRREKIRRYLRALEDPALTTETTALMEMGRSEPAPTSSAAAADANINDLPAGRTERRPLAAAVRADSVQGRSNARRLG